MKSLIGDLLDLAKLEAGYTELDKTTCPVDDLLSELIDELTPIANQKQIQLHVNQDKSLKVFCDQQKVQQILSNLLGNAIKFTPPGGDVEISVFDKSRVLEFEIKDTGPGISNEQMSHIFDRFWQARKTANLGTGL